tara:strand:+ start:2344 stop:4902 length:2559 start_codon:yes stop_codon:yes gene_type:complete
MATNLSSTGIEVEKVDTADIPTGGTGKVLLYASGSGSDTKLYVKEGSDTQVQLGFDIDQLSALGGTGLHQTQDHFAFSDNGTEKKITFSNLEDAIFGNVSGDATIAAGGALTIANDAVESGMLNDNVISGQTELASDGLAAADELMISDGGTLKKIGVDNLFKDGPGLLGAEAIAVGSDHFMFLDGGATGDAKVESVADLMTAVAGDGLAASSGVLAVGVDDSSIELNSDALRVKASGVTNAMLAGSIANAKLANDSVTIGSTECDLGSTTTVFAGITQLTASNIQVTNLDVVTLNSVSQTETTLEVADKLIVAALSASSANSDGGGLKIGGGQNSAGNASILYDHSNTALDFNIGGTTEIRLADGVLRPETDNDVDLGASGAEFKDLYLDGVAYIDDLRPDLLKMPDNTSGKILVADGTSFEEVAMSGDVAIASNGATTIQADAVESGMLNDNVISGQTELASDGLAAADEMMISDGGTLKKIGVDNLMKDGPGLLSAAAVAVADDHFMFLDGGATGDAKIESVADLMTAVAGDGLAASSGVLAVGVDDSSIELNSDALRVKAQGITNAMLADDAVGADELAANAVVNASVASNAAIEGTKLNLNVDFGGNIQIGSQSDDVCAFGGPIKVGGNAIADSSGNAAITFDGSQNISIGAAITGPSGYASGDFAITSNGSGSFAGDLIVGRSGQHAGGDATFHGDATGEKAFYSGANNVFQVTGSAASGLQVSIGGNATSEFAVDVANGSNNNNKMRAAAFVTYSDESLKQDVATMNTALDTVMSLEGVEFTWKDSGERDFGFIAQDVHSVLPKAVHTAENGVQGVDYSRLTSVLVEAVKAQQVQIEELKALLKK